MAPTKPQAATSTAPASVASPVVPETSTAPRGTLYAIPAATNGVAMTSPGLSILGSVSAAVAEACKSIPADKHVALVAVTSTVGGEPRSNLALAARVGDDFVVTAWVGRTWKKDAKTEWGAQLVVTL